MSHEVRLKREAVEKAFEASKDKDRTITRLEELRFLALSTKDLSPDDAYWINLQKNKSKTNFDRTIEILRSESVYTTLEFGFLYSKNPKISGSGREKRPEFPCLGVCCYLAQIIAINLDTSSDNSSSDSHNNTSDSASTSQISTYEEIDYDSPKYKGPPKSLLKWFGYLSDEYKDKDSLDDMKGPSKVSVPIFEGPSVQGLLDHYGYNDIEEYLSWNYFPSTDKENTNKDITGEDCIHESNYAMSKGKYVPVSQKHNPKVKSLILVTGCVRGLANVTTWDENMNKMGVRKSDFYADKAKGKRKVSYGS
ncbi:hypothetical protein Tco_0179704 [Tanacetum coccineum]